MLGTWQKLIVSELEQGTGAAIQVAIDQSGIRSGMKIWFKDLDQKNGPVAELRIHGLKSHRVRLTLGSFSGGVIRLMGEASLEDIQLAHALIDSIKPKASVFSNGELVEDWSVNDGSFKIEVTIPHQVKPETSEAVSETCRNVIVPIMAAMAELIGYDPVPNPAEFGAPAIEGAVTTFLSKKRERNPRNRLLCIRIHGEACLACGFEPQKFYGDTGSIIEVHHLTPLASLTSPKAYDPATDLVPLCPNCHRVAHKRTPVPWSIKEIRELMEAVHD